MTHVITNPLLWSGFIFIVVVSIIIATTVSRRRSKELEELDKIFPEEHFIQEDSVTMLERVPRTTRRQEKGKKQHPPVVLPKRGAKKGRAHLHAIESCDTLESKKVEAQNLSDVSHLEEKRKSTSLLTSLGSKISTEVVNAEDFSHEKLDVMASKHLYKKSLLGPMQADKAEGLIEKELFYAGPKQLDKGKEATLKESEDYTIQFPSRSKRRSRKKPS